MKDTDIKLQVLICTFGKVGIRNIVTADHPHVDGVEYLVSWQLPEGDEPVPEELVNRPDFKVIKSATRGLSRNRNLALQAATAPFCLISDDDVQYTSEQLRLIIDSFEHHPEADIIAFKYASTGDQKWYPDETFSLAKPPKGYFISSIEIAFRRENILETGILFNERFGIGGEYMAGEEDVFIHDALNHNLHGIFIPEFIATHNHASTGVRHNTTPAFIRTKGATFVHTHPHTWPLRMLLHALRHNSPDLSRFQYIKQWLDGATAERKISFNCKHRH